MPDILNNSLLQK